MRTLGKTVLRHSSFTLLREDLPLFGSGEKSRGYAGLRSGSFTRLRPSADGLRHSSAAQKAAQGSFTLVELLVVIAIIGMLMGILLPALSAAKKMARKTRTKTELNQLVTAWKSYRMDYKKFPSAITEMDATAVKILGGQDQSQNYLQLKYLEFKDFNNPFNDPWGTIYKVALDYDGDNQVTADGEAGVNVDVAAWSAGPDKLFGTGDDVKNWK